MRLEEVKRGFWGYKKAQIFQYLTQMEAEFTQKFQEQEALHRQAEANAKQRIDSLEAENRSLREQLEDMRGHQDQISRAILDARASAEAMKAETLAYEEKARADLRQALEKDHADLARYREKITDLRGLICQVLEEMGEKSEWLNQQVDELEGSAHLNNFSLFQ